MELKKINDDHWVWGEYHITYINEWGNSGWTTDPRPFSKRYDSFLEVLNHILGERTRPKLLPKPAGLKK